MNLDIRSLGFDLTPALLQHTERRLAFALARFTPLIRAVTVRLEDLNGPKGGLDKRCRVAATLDGQAALRAEATGADLYAAIDAAADRLGRMVVRAKNRLEA